VDPESGEVWVKKGRMYTQRAIKQMKAAGLETIPVAPEELIGKVSAYDIKDPNSDDILVPANEELSDDIIAKIKGAGINSFEILYTGGVGNSDSIRKTLLLDKVNNKEDALIEIYRLMRPGNPATPEVAQDFLDHLFFKSAYYDLSGVGRLKINLRLGINAPVNLRTLRKEDILLTTKTLIELRDTQGVVDDIDHLGNRRVRAVGELLENQYPSAWCVWNVPSRNA
jgi:DNA-directed RNA polymerase subunit beta